MLGVRFDMDFSSWKRRSWGWYQEMCDSCLRSRAVGLMVVDAEWLYDAKSLFYKYFFQGRSHAKPQSAIVRNWLFSIQRLLLRKQTDFAQSGRLALEAVISLGIVGAGVPRAPGTAEFRHLCLGPASPKWKSLFLIKRCRKNSTSQELT